MKTAAKTLYILLLALLLGAFLVCAMLLSRYYLQGRQTQQAYDLLEQLLTQPVQSTAPFPEAEPMLPEFGALYALNPDLVGWLRLETLDISYPVVQRPDDPDYYLHRDFYGQPSTRGCIYARPESDVFAPSDNITLYGHRMRDGTMFGRLGAYESRAFWEENQYFGFDTLRERRTYRIICVLKVSAGSEAALRCHLFTDAVSEADFAAHWALCRSLALYDTGLTADWGDRLITLSTCEYSQADGRLVIVAKEVS